MSLDQHVENLHSQCRTCALTEEIESLNDEIRVVSRHVIHVAPKAIAISGNRLKRQGVAQVNHMEKRR